MNSAIGCTDFSLCATPCHRERKRQKAQELQEAVDALTGQVEELRHVKDENEGLQRQLHLMQRTLAEKDSDLARLRTAANAADGDF